MGEWYRTTVLFCGREQVEKALDHFADRSGFEKTTFDPTILSPKTFNRMLYSNTQSATTWLIVLQAKSHNVTIVKSFPLNLMTASFSPATTRPLLATICALIGCYGIYCSLEDGESRFWIAADNAGNYQIAGSTFDEDEDPIWVPDQQWTLESPRENDTETIKNAFGLFGIAPCGNRKIGERFLIEHANLSAAEISDGFMDNLASIARSSHCVILAYQDRNSTD